MRCSCLTWTPLAPSRPGRSGMGRCPRGSQSVQVILIYFYGGNYKHKLNIYISKGFDNFIILSPYRLVTRALLTREEAVGALIEWVLGKTQHDDLLLDPQAYLGVHGVLPVLPLILLGLGHHCRR